MLSETKRMVSTFVKENKRLACTIRAFEQLNEQEQELQRESLRTNIQLGFQIYQALETCSFEDNEMYKIIKRDFQLACRTLEDLIELLVIKQKDAQRFRIRFFEQIPLLNGSGDLEEEKEFAPISIERVPRNQNELLQEAFNSLTRTERMSEELTSITLDKLLDIGESNKGNKRPIRRQASKIFHIK